MACLLSRIVLLILALLIFGNRTFAAEPARPSFRTIEAVQSGWDAETPPPGGWTEVTLPDDWSRRWPDFDGVTWYRLTFDHGDTSLPTAVMFDYWSLAGAAWLNGALLDRDASLVEPLSRSWNVSRYFRLPAQLLRGKDNVLLVRVSGLSAYQPGLGEVAVGDAAELKARFARAELLRHDLPLVSLAITLSLGGFFLVVWAMRRSEAAYGWYALMSLAWALYTSNFVAVSPWPFTTTDGSARFTMIAFMATVAAFTMFCIRFAGRRFRVVETGLWLALAAGTIWMVLALPHQIATTRIILSLAATLVYFAAFFLFLGLTWNSRRIDYAILNVVNMLILGAGVHDVALFTGVLSGTMYISPALSQVRLLSMAFVLAWHYVASLKRIERFNDELVGKITTAREELAFTLSQQHELALANTIVDERVNLAHNLHDGLGGTLVNNIALLEHSPRAMSGDRFLSVLKELREELRAVVDISTGHQTEERSLSEWLAPLRSRFTLLCESRGIVCLWDTEGLDAYRLPARRGLDWMRILQESLTNALKHSDASRIHIGLRPQDDSLRLTIADNGRGFDPARPRTGGTGLVSLRKRAGRIGATFDIRSGSNGTILTFDIPHSDIAAQPG